MTTEQKMHIEHLEDRIALLTMHFRESVKALRVLDSKKADDLGREHTMAMQGLREKHARAVDAYRESLKAPVYNPEA